MQEPRKFLHTNPGHSLAERFSGKLMSLNMASFFPVILWSSLASGGALTCLLNTKSLVTCRGAPRLPMEEMSPPLHRGPLLPWCLWWGRETACLRDPGACVVPDTEKGLIGMCCVPWADSQDGVGGDQPKESPLEVCLFYLHHLSIVGIGLFPFKIQIDTKLLLFKRFPQFTFQAHLLEQSPYF